MRWKAYFIIISFVYLWILFVSLERISTWTLRDVFDCLLLIVSLTGVFIYTFKKNPINPFIWRFVFWISIIDTILYLIYQFTPLKNAFLLQVIYSSEIYKVATEAPAVVCIFCISFSLALFAPSAYAFFKLGYPKRIKIMRKRKLIKSKFLL